MGTRHLTIVIKDENPVVAQYGQWDGYPNGAGTNVLKFLNDVDLGKFSEKLKLTRFATDAEIDELDEMHNLLDKYPWMSRNVGSDILSFIYTGQYSTKDFFSGKVTTINKQPDLLVNSYNFAADSLFCEWAWLIDLDNNTFECYKGFNEEPLSMFDRFYDITDDSKNLKYYPIKLVKTYMLDNLPTNFIFLKDLTDE